MMMKEEPQLEDIIEDERRTDKNISNDKKDNTSVH